MINKAVILCGGLGSRLAEETKIIPKPMVKIGQKPIVCHIIDIYRSYGVKEFYLLTGYKSKIIKDYFLSHYTNLKIHIFYTGKNTQTGGRLLKAKKFFKKNEDFFLTYGDGVSDVDLNKLMKFHYQMKRTATVTAVRPPLRFGELKIKSNKVFHFAEKTYSHESWISGGYFVFNYKIFKHIKKFSTVLELDPIKKLVKLKELSAFKHYGFWQCMDTLREKKILNKIWYKGNAPWKK